MKKKFNKKIQNSPMRFINRELSWLSFNDRVLSESKNLRNLLIERLRFLSISGNNLDEFHMVRVAGLYRLMKQKVSMRTDDGRTTRQQFNDVTKSLRSLLKKQQNIWNSLKKKLGMTIILISHDISVVNYLSDRTFVMHNGEIVESGITNTILKEPSKKYTKRLLNAVYKIKRQK